MRSTLDMYATDRPERRPIRQPAMAKKFPLHPKHPERICWGCDRYCPTDSLACGNGSPHHAPRRTAGRGLVYGGDWGFDDDEIKPQEQVVKQTAQS